MKVKHSVMWKRYLWILFHIRTVCRWLSESKSLVEHENDPRTVEENMTRPSADALVLHAKMRDADDFWKLWTMQVLFF